MAANPSGPHDRITESKLNETTTTTSTKPKSKNLKFKKTPSEKENETRDEIFSENRETELKKSSSRSNCQCTNIGIMQLFYEMKQEFPKVPDHIVSQCVEENCHNRSACIESLTKETINSVQNSYPSQSLMNRHQNKNNNNQNVTNNSGSGSGSGKSIKGLVGYVNGHLKKNDIIEFSRSFFDRKSNKDKDKEHSNSNSSLASISSSSSNSGGGGGCGGVAASGCVGSDNNNSSDMPYSVTSSNESLTPTPQQQHQLQQQQYFQNQRPTTLNIANTQDSHSNPNPAYFGTSGNNNNYRITRAAPPPPPPNSASSSHSSVAPPYFQNFQQTTSYGSPSSPGTISLKVTNSPKLSHGSTSPRHKTTINLQPDLPGLNVPSGGRSFTSVHLDVRPPSDSPQSPINITAGPMKFSSSSYNAQQGHQSHMEITIGGDGGTFSTMRKRTGNYLNNPGQNINGRVDFEEVTWANQEIAPNEATTISKQLQRKEKLVSKLEQEKNRFEQMERELGVLQMPIQADGAIGLQEEIKRLGRVCDEMTQELERRYEERKLLQSRKPPRPPPPSSLAVLQSMNNNGNQRTPSPLPSSLIAANQPSTYMNNNNFNYINHSNNYNNNNDSSSREEQQPWTCSRCTFQNHPLLKECEQCDMGNIQIENNGGTGIHNINPANYIPRIQDARLYKAAPPPSAENFLNATNGSFDPPPNTPSPSSPAKMLQHQYLITK